MSQGPSAATGHSVTTPASCHVCKKLGGFAQERHPSSRSSRIFCRPGPSDVSSETSRYLKGSDYHDSCFIYMKKQKFSEIEDCLACPRRHSYGKGGWNLKQAGLLSAIIRIKETHGFYQRASSSPSASELDRGGKGLPWPLKMSQDRSVFWGRCKK